MKHKFQEHEEISRFTIMFSGDALELDLEEDGIKTANGWSIYPLFPPIVSFVSNIALHVDNVCTHNYL